MAYVRLSGIGMASGPPATTTPTPPATPVVAPAKPAMQLGATSIVWSSLSVASMAASVFHGYKRNDSVGWAIIWGLLGGLFPVITPAIALAQGFGQPVKK